MGHDLTFIYQKLNIIKKLDYGMKFLLFQKKHLIFRWEQLEPQF